jgi:hypothetical protein
MFLGFSWPISFSLHASVKPRVGLSLCREVSYILYQVVRWGIVFSQFDLCSFTEFLLEILLPWISITLSLTNRYRKVFYISEYLQKKKKKKKHFKKRVIHSSQQNFLPIIYLTRCRSANALNRENGTFLTSSFPLLVILHKNLHSLAYRPTLTD